MELEPNAIKNPNGYKSTRPNTFLIGGARCATSTLSGWLGQHPEILLSVPKESNFFQMDIFQKGMDWYSKKYFRGYNQEKIVLDASPDYFHIKYVAPRIFTTCEEPKFIAMIREPMARAYSHYSLVSGWRAGRVRETFEKELGYNLQHFSYDRFRYEEEVVARTDYKGGTYSPTIIERSLFYHNLKHWIECFGGSRIFIGEFDNLCLAPNFLIDSICEFLEIKYFKPILETRNIGGGAEKDLHELCNEGKIAMHVAKEIFLPDVEKLSKLMNVDLIKKWGYDKL